MALVGRVRKAFLRNTAWIGAVTGFMVLTVPATMSAQKAPVRATLATDEIKPILRTAAVPKYPAEAVTAKLDGIVNAEVVVQPSGVLHARVVDISPKGFIPAAAVLDAIFRSQFRAPVNASGNSVITLVGMRYTFTASGATPHVSASLFTLPQVRPQSSVQNGETPPPGDAPGVTPPRIIRTITPAYTFVGMGVRITGEVHLEAIIESDGTVSATTVIKSLDRRIDEAARAAASYWLFEPARRNGQPIRTSVNLIQDFK